jgi:hypothetical protein
LGACALCSLFSVQTNKKKVRSTISHHLLFGTLWTGGLCLLKILPTVMS